MLKKEEKNRYFRNILILICAVLLFQLCLGGVFIYLLKSDQEEDSKVPVGDSRGERFEYPDFYYAESGTWRLDDSKADILKEQKFISPSERDEYLVLEIKKGAEIRILKAEQRWKYLEVLEKGKVKAKGWLDANSVRKALQLDSENKETEDGGKEESE